MGGALGLCAVCAEGDVSSRRLEGYAHSLSLPIVAQVSDDYAYYLLVSEECISLQAAISQHMSPLCVDFLSAKNTHRISYGGGAGQLLSKAIGLKRKKNPKVLDVTAGLGRDGFLLAMLGCQVMMLERCAIIAALLEDGLRRWRADPQSVSLDLQLTQVDALTYLAACHAARYDVIYIDPMFPVSNKSALVKKDMRILRDIAGSDNDMGQLLATACRSGVHRVVVKRPLHGPCLNDQAPSLQFKGKSVRYDVYVQN